MPEVENIEILLNYLLGEYPRYSDLIIPSDLIGKRQLMRSLMNLRPPASISGHLLEAQDEELQKQLREKGIVELKEAPGSPIDKRLKLWQGDITRLKVDAIVNAANSQMLGCFVPLHSCIDNAIHSAAGIQLRLECNELMKTQGYPEPTGSAKITSAYNLPSKFVIHTVGPIICSGGVTQKEESQLADCYRLCLRLAGECNLKSIGFCCISTGEFRFPNQLAAEIAIRTVREYFELSPTSGIETVVFNVFKDIDYSIYRKLLQLDLG
jgi:O-acetyl-ADP-ribose deacetylase (regulator of RNase III)